ncbi:unnamed protein product [Rotaria sordida]|uniref:Acetyl-coenzyme A synthetase n=1 Tax=Rotaria sordida TaxID=392033 RepID=A0A815LJ25_9BILA|nr:unnamed protein product [Rotaria sordida]
MLWTTKYHYGKTSIRYLSIWIKNLNDISRSTSRFYTLSTCHFSIASSSTLVKNSTNHNAIHQPVTQRSILLSSTNNYLSNPLVTRLCRATSTHSIWNETALPDKIKTLDEYKAIYALSIKDPNRFWKMAAECLDWYQFPTKIKNTEFDYRTSRGVDIKWYEDGIINVCYNCLDRHIHHDHSIAQQVALIFEPDTPTESRHHITYAELLRDVKKFANVLKKHGVKKGDRVTLYMPMVIEACVAMLACARIGAVHSVIFGGFSPNNIAERISGCDSTVIITTDFGVRGGKSSPLKTKIDQALALKQCSNVKTVLVFERNHGMTELKDDCSHLRKTLEWTDGRDFWVHKEMETVNDKCEPERMNAEDPLFILYTSGSTGTPKGIVHTTGGYLTYTSLTFKYSFDYNPGDVYMCTADIGWITGHSYVVYGPLANRATTVIFEGIPTYPDVSRYWNIIDKHEVNIFYTAPTAIRSLMQHDDAYVTKTNRQSLRILGSVGEPINPEAWKWYHSVVGDNRCPIIDTWWQTETGGIMISPIPNAWELEPGSATFPFFGIQTQLFDQTTKKPLKPPNHGELCIADSWPGQARSLYRNHERFVDVYFKTYPGYYFTGDGCEIKPNGYHWITGRVDDVLVISGHNIGTAEVEAALEEHTSVTEAAVVGYPDPKKNQGMYCFVTLKGNVKPSEELRKELIRSVRDSIGAHVYPDVIHFTSNLPKTRSGKIMRRILRKIVEPDTSNLGDTSTLNDPTIVEELIKNSPRTKRS